MELVLKLGSCALRDNWLVPFAGFTRSLPFSLSISTSSISSTVTSASIGFVWDGSVDEDLDFFLGLSVSSASSTVYVTVSTGTDVGRDGEGERGGSPACLFSRCAGGRERLLPYGLDEFASVSEYLGSIPSEVWLQ